MHAVNVVSTCPAQVVHSKTYSDRVPQASSRWCHVGILILNASVSLNLDTTLYNVPFGIHSCTGACVAEATESFVICIYSTRRPPA